MKIDASTQRSSTGPRQSSTTKKAAASGWIGSALEYYDWFIYAQAAALVFPGVFFPAGNPTVALIASLGTYAVGYVARPIGAFVLGQWGDKHGRKNVLVLAMLMMGVSTFAVALLPTYGQVGLLAPILLVAVRLIQGFAVAGELSGASAMIVEHAPFGRRGFYASFALQGTQAGQIIAAAVFLPLSAVLSNEAFKSWGWRIPFLLSALVVFAGYMIRRRVEETPIFTEEKAHQEIPKMPIVRVLRESGLDVVRAVCMTLVNVVGVTVAVFGAAYATQPGYGVGMSTTVYLWIPVLANVVALALIPLFGDLSDRFGRRPLMIFGSLSSGVLAYAYLYAVSQNNVLLTIVLSIIMWGTLYQVWNATFASFFQELFPARTRVTGFAISQNIGLVITAFLPSIFAAIAPPGSANVPLIIGSICFGICIIGAVAAWSARETYRIPLNQLGTVNATPVAREEYRRLRSGSR
ncbi:MFS transporter [Arthrobacter sp. AZCC_0090]|uniref:MFS transporter n=1 Tax=Arthrobacter sp. AZCC_0090 TaxID=2735881 RepID=UPI00160BAEE3|nr:MFS transporter [Arthrobacter sp. AZCC_0090]MBB6406257.1 MFS family permease [Arthrobacter sp. AZCC_0090]